MPKRLTTSEFVENAIKVHGNSYDYSRAEYKNNKTKIIIICNKHGEFKQTSSHHIGDKNGCPSCNMSHSKESKNKWHKKAIEKATIIHGDKYNYSKVIYKNMKTKVIIICPKHGEFKQPLDRHINQKSGCPKCYEEVRGFKLIGKYTLENVIKAFKDKHQNTYDYSKIKEFKNTSSKVPIRCSIHGLFYQKIISHMKGIKCPKCSKKATLTNEDFIHRSKYVHEKNNKKYDYSKTVYVNQKTKVIIICNLHGEFKQQALNHLNGTGCPKCSKEYVIGKLKNSTKDFIKKAIKIHGDIFDYSKTEYKGSYEKVTIYCKKHNGYFTTLAHSHTTGTGCNICCESKMERKIRFILKKKKINFKCQYKFKKCFNKRSLRFDFVIFEDNIPIALIECDGKQHFYPIEFFGGNKKFTLQQKNDIIKNNFSIDTKLPLLRISYKSNMSQYDANIELFLKKVKEGDKSITYLNKEEYDMSPCPEISAQ